MLFRPGRASDMDEICTLLASARHGAEYYHALFAADPCFDPSQFRLAWTAGHIVACAKIYPRLLRIGTAVTPVGGIGNVRTDPRHWQKGLATSLLGECLSTLYLEGMTLSPLFAPRHTLFARRGWCAMAAVQLEIPAQALRAAPPAAAPKTAVRALEGHDLDAVMALHESANAGRTGSAVRTRDDWLDRLTALDLQKTAFLVAEREGEIVGYAAAQPQGKQVDVLELLLAPWAEDAWRPLLAAASKAPSVATVRAWLPGDYRRLVCDAIPDTVIARDDLLMLRLVDPLRLLQGLVPLLTARLREGEDATVEPLEVRVGHLRGGAVLRVAESAVTVDRPRRDDAHTLPDAAFLTLLLGTESARDELAAAALPPAACATLLRLFPPQDWVYWRSDAF
jgi:predicted N-acetyltransferase YhbS